MNSYRFRQALPAGYTVAFGLPLGVCFVSRGDGVPLDYFLSAEFFHHAVL